MKASDNPFPSFLVTETAAASIATPGSGDQHLFIDTADHVLKYKNSGGSVSDVASGGSSGYIGYVKVQDQKTAGTASGTFTSGSWQTRVLNTEVTDTNSDCTLASNQMTLSAGVYDCLAMAPANTVDRHQARLRNVTDSTTLIVGMSMFQNSGTAVENIASVMGRFTIGASKAIEFQHRCQTTKSTNGFGLEANFDEVEVYATVLLWRVS